MATWSPTPAEVKALVPQRVGTGAFSAATVPTLADVQSLIDNVSHEVTAAAGGTVPGSLESLARWVAALGAAAYVEQSFFPEQQTDDTNVANMYRRYTDALERLAQTAAATGTTTVSPGSPTAGSLGSTRVGSATTAYLDDLRTL